MDLLLHGIVVLCFLLALVGSVVPIMPGPVLGLVALFFHKLILGPASVSWTFLAVASTVVLVTAILEFLLCGATTRLCGGTRQGMVGAIIGLPVGLLLIGPIGLLIGPVAGALLFEWIQQRSWPCAARAGAGALLGSIGSIVLRLAVSCGLLFAFLVAG